MCWLAAAPLAISAFGAVVGHQEQKKAARRQDAAIAEQRAADETALLFQKDELNRSVNENISIRAREAMVERSRLSAVQASSGLIDNSGRLARQSRFNEGYDISSFDENRRRQLRQMEVENKAGGAALSKRSAEIRRPSTIGTTLSIAQAGFDFAENKLPPGAFGFGKSGSASGTPTLIGDFPSNVVDVG